RFVLQPASPGAGAGTCQAGGSGPSTFITNTALSDPFSRLWNVARSSRRSASMTSSYAPNSCVLRLFVTTLRRGSSFRRAMNARIGATKSLLSGYRLISTPMSMHVPSAGCRQYRTHRRKAAAAMIAAGARIACPGGHGGGGTMTREIQVQQADALTREPLTG